MCANSRRDIVERWLKGSIAALSVLFFLTVVGWAGAQMLGDHGYAAMRSAVDKEGIAVTFIDPPTPFNRSRYDFDGVGPNGLEVTGYAERKRDAGGREVWKITYQLAKKPAP